MQVNPQTINPTDTDLKLQSHVIQIGSNVILIRFCLIRTRPF